MFHLIRVDPERNMNRWYCVGVQSTLFDAVAVVCGWGRRGGAYARWRIISAETRQDAQKLAAEIVRRKLCHGYSRVDEKADF